MSLVWINLREENLIGNLVEDSHHTQNEYRPRVREHPSKQFPVEMPVYLEQIWDEEEGNETCAKQVNEEDIEDTCLAKKDKENKVERNVEEDEEHLQRHETDGTMLETKEAERQSLQGIQGHYGGHHQQVIWMLSVSKVVRNGCDEAEDKQKIDGCKASHHRKAGRKDGIGFLALIVGESEERRLHAKSQYGEEQSCVRIHVCAHTIVARSLGHIVCVEWDEQVVEKTSHYARESVYGRIFGQSFEVCHCQS